MKAVDSNIMIFHLVSDSIFGKRASEIIHNIQTGEPAFIPLAAFKETLFILLKKGRNIKTLAEFFISLNLNSVKIAEDDYEIFMHGLKLAEEYKLSAGDGVIIATMMKHGIAEIYSNDEGFDNVPGIKRIF